MYCLYRKTQIVCKQLASACKIATLVSHPLFANLLQATKLCWLTTLHKGLGTRTRIQASADRNKDRKRTRTGTGTGHGQDTDRDTDKDMERYTDRDR
jgi:hypothetical protein